MVGKIKEALGGELQGKTIGVLGLSFKPETDDMRDAPAIEIIAGLQEGGAQVRAFDPVAMDAAAAVIPNLEFCKDSYVVADGADALVIMTEWNQFRMLDLERIYKLLRQPIVIDLRNVYDPAPMRKQGFSYVSVGR
jgi:UDPglucose 6-dehydrogenase